MLKEAIMVVVSCICTTAVNEWRFKARQKDALISKIVDTFVKLRNEENRNRTGIHELWHLQFSGILLLKREKDAEKVLEQVKCKGFPIDLPNFMRHKGILKGLREAIEENVDLNEFRDITTKQIEEAMKSKDPNF